MQNMNPTSLKAQFLPAPEKQMKSENFQTDNQKVEGVKAAIHAEMKVVEGCMGRCAVSYNAPDAAYADKFTAAEGVCLQKCYGKYLDSALLLDKEVKLYTQGSRFMN